MDSITKLFVTLHVFAHSLTTKNGEGERGATATEYALLVVGICVLLGAATAVFGGALSGFFDGLGTKVGITTPPAK